MKLLMIALALLFSISAYSLEELDFSSYLANNDSIAGVDRSVQNVAIISQGQYISGGVVGTVFGFGIGHAIQGRWTKTGWIHTTLQSGAGAIVITGLLLTETPSFSLGLAGLYYIFPIGLAVLSGAKIWEIIDVWVLPSSMKAVSQKGLHMTPTLYSQHNQGNFLGLQLQYKF